MKERKAMKVILLILSLFLSIPSQEAMSWHDETHIAIARAAGYERWYNVTGPDIARVKAGAKEGYNHFVNNQPDMKITPEMVLEQAERYNDPGDRGGHLYGAIIASLREYIRTQERGRFHRYALAYCFHYIGDLSQPLHHIPYDDFNRRYHQLIEEAADEYIAKDGIRKITSYMYDIEIDPENPERDIACHIARISNISLKLAERLKREGRVMTEEEVLRQIAHSASLIKGILGYLRHKFNK